MCVIEFILLLYSLFYANYQNMNMSHRPFIMHPRKVKYIYHTNTWNGGSYEAHPSVRHNKHKTASHVSSSMFFLRSLHRTKLLI
jgi:hypothetical protein